jgi:hypothetical protein
MNFDPVEDSIVDQLQSKFAESGLPFEARKLPDAEADYKRAVNGIVAYVFYTGSGSPGVKNTNPVTQDRKAQFSVEIFGRKRKGGDGVSAASHLMELALIGFKPISCDRLYLVRDDYNKDGEGFWIHIYQLECVTRLVQDSLTETVLVPSFTTLSTTFINEANAGDADNGQEVILIP